MYFGDKMALLIKNGPIGKEETQFVGVSIGIDGTFRLIFKDRDYREIWFGREEGGVLYNEIKKFHTEKNSITKKRTHTDVSDEELLRSIGCSEKEIQKTMNEAGEEFLKTTFKNILSSQTIEEVERIVRAAQIDEKRLELYNFYAELCNISQRYAQKIYEEIGRSGLVRDEIEGSGSSPGFGHTVWATALITIAWTSWLFEDKALNRIGKEMAKQYRDEIIASVKAAMETGQDYVGKERKTLT